MQTIQPDRHDETNDHEMTAWLVEVDDLAGRWWRRVVQRDHIAAQIAAGERSRGHSVTVTRVYLMPIRTVPEPQLIRCGRARRDGLSCGTPVARAGLSCFAHRDQDEAVRVDG